MQVYKAATASPKRMIFMRIVFHYNWLERHVILVLSMRRGKEGRAESLTPWSRWSLISLISRLLDNTIGIWLTFFIQSANTLRVRNLSASCYPNFELLSLMMMAENVWNRHCHCRRSAVWWLMWGCIIILSLTICSRVLSTHKVWVGQVTKHTWALWERNAERKQKMSKV